MKRLRDDPGMVEAVAETLFTFRDPTSAWSQLGSSYREGWLAEARAVLTAVDQRLVRSTTP